MQDSNRVRCIELLTDWVNVSKYEFESDAPLKQSLQFGYTFAEIDADFLWDIKTSLDEIGSSKYSKPRSPSEWATVFGRTWKTVKKNIDNGGIRAIEINSKSYRIHFDDIPDH